VKVSWLIAPRESCYFGSLSTVSPSLYLWISSLQDGKNLKEMKKTDCKCLFHKFGYAVKQNCEKTCEEFDKAMAAALEHFLANMNSVILLVHFLKGISPQVN